MFTKSTDKISYSLVVITEIHMTEGYLEKLSIAILF